MKCFRVMSSGDMNSASRGYITGFPWKILSIWPFKVRENRGARNSNRTRRPPQSVRTARMNKTLKGCAIRPPKEDNIMHMRVPKCDETFSIVDMHQVQIY